MWWKLIQISDRDQFIAVSSDFVYSVVRMGSTSHAVPSVWTMLGLLEKVWGFENAHTIRRLCGLWRQRQETIW